MFLFNSCPITNDDHTFDLHPATWNWWSFITKRINYNLIFSINQSISFIQRNQVTSQRHFGYNLTLLLFNFCVIIIRSNIFETFLFIKTSLSVIPYQLYYLTSYTLKPSLKPTYQININSRLRFFQI